MMPDRKVGTSEKDLTEYYRPLEGGWAIAYNDPELSGDYFYRCTLGFNALWEGKQVFITAAHCSQDEWGTDGTKMYQPFPRDSRYIGKEIYDPAPFECGPFWDTDACRYSDAAIVRLASGVSATLGAIARTSYNAYGYGNEGSTVIDADQPRFTIVGSAGDVNGGEYVHKVGFVTGWTTGQVTKGCVDVEQGGQRLICQAFADLGLEDGDSGGPVFKRNAGENEVLLQGVVWGKIPADEVVIFSDMNNIEIDLGELTVVYPQLEVQIQGPSEVSTYATETWSSSLSNATAPVDYAWYRDGSLVSTSDHYTGNTGGGADFVLKLKIVDADGKKDTDSLSVVVGEPDYSYDGGDGGDCGTKIQC